MVRHRKLQLLFFTIIFSLLAAATVGLLFFMAYQVTGRS